jgi:hypothetical protein
VNRAHSASSQWNLWGPTAETLEDRFREFHEENPHVYEEIVRLCRKAKERGRQRWGIGGVFEVLRWSWLKTTGEEFKLNNNHRAFYARLVMEREPDLAGFFQLREHTAA